MKQDAQVKMMIGISAGIVAVAAAGFGMHAFLDKKDTTPSKSITVPDLAAPAAADYSAAVSAISDDAGSSTGLNAEEARRIGEEVARQVAEQVARSVVAQSTGNQPASSEGLNEADARRIGAEEGRRVAQEVTATMLQDAAASSGGSSSLGGMTAAEAEQIGMAAGRRAAEQVAADTARGVVRNEFGGSVTRKSKSTSSKAVSSGQSDAPNVPSSEVLQAWWTAPGEGDFGLVHAGQSKGERAIALLFSDAPATGALEQSVRVYNVKGVLVSNAWSTSSNPRMGLLRKLKPGRYTVVIDASLTSIDGKAIPKALHGPVYVR